MENKEMSPEKSLQIISDAIAKSRKDFEKNAGTPMIFWGTLVFLWSIAVWIMLKQTDNLNWNFLWFGIPIVGWPLFAIYLKHNDNKSTGKGNTFISKTLSQIWIIFGIFSTVLAATFSLMNAPEYIGFMVIVLLGFAATMTGLVLKNYLITAGGILTGIGCSIAIFLVKEYDATLFFAVAAVLNLIIPGIVMNKKAK